MSSRPRTRLARALASTLYANDEGTDHRPIPSEHFPAPLRAIFIVIATAATKMELARPIGVKGGRKLETLADVRDFILEEPDYIQTRQSWQRAAKLLIEAAEDPAASTPRPSRSSLRCSPRRGWCCDDQNKTEEGAVPAFVAPCPSPLRSSEG